MEQEIKIGDKLQFPDGDIATINKIKEHKNEEDDKGFYDALEVIFTIDGDDEQMEFKEVLDSREDYKFNVMKPI